MAASSRQKGHSERRHDHLSSCIYIVEVLGDGCQHWNEEFERENRDRETYLRVDGQTAPVANHSGGYHVS